MMVENTAGNYMFLPGGSPYSSGVRALPGYELIHTTLKRPLRVAEGIAAIAQYLARSARPASALCGVELRCPAPYSFDGFAAFNHEYQRLLRNHGMLPEGDNPVARTNIAPELTPPTEQVIHAFTYTVPTTTGGNRPSFVVSGAGELMQSALNSSAIIRAGEVSDDAMAEKVALVMEIMQSRLDSLKVTWADVTVVNIYTVHNLISFLRPVILEQMGPAARFGVRWYFSRPPVTGIEFEMDLRGVEMERHEEITQCGVTPSSLSAHF